MNIRFKEGLFYIFCMLGLVWAGIAFMFIFSGCTKKITKIETKYQVDTLLQIDTVKEYIPAEPAEMPDIQLPMLFFDHDKYYIRKEYYTELEKIGNYLAQSGKSVIIEGHCDETGSNEYNMSLGEMRATMVFDYLEEYTKKLETISYGEEMPLEPNTGNNEKNRRVVFRYK